MIKDFEPPSKKEFIKIKKRISSWGKTADLVYETFDPSFIYLLLYVEQRSYNRPYNKKRLHQRFNRLRCNLELRDFKDLVADCSMLPEHNQVLRNQVTLSIYLNDKIKTEKLYLQLLKTEYYTRKRSYMYKQLYGSFQKLRRIKELKIL